MATVILVRHGRTDANARGILAGRTPGVELDEVGRTQADATAARLAGLPLAALVASPLERCQQTASRIVATRSTPLDIATDERLTECNYGSWQGHALVDLAKEPLWKVIQSRPSEAVFPDGEAMSAMQDRSVAAIRERDAAITAAHGDDAIWVAVSHADIIKAILADALGMRLDLFQRIVVGPASVSIIRYGGEQPEVLTTNSTSGGLPKLGS